LSAANRIFQQFHLGEQQSPPAYIFLPPLPDILEQVQVRRLNVMAMMQSIQLLFSRSALARTVPWVSPEVAVSAFACAGVAKSNSSSLARAASAALSSHSLRTAMRAHSTTEKGEKSHAASQTFALRETPRKFGRRPPQNFVGVRQRPKKTSKINWRRTARLTAPNAD
jgi:hypothetical protein